MSPGAVAPSRPVCPSWLQLVGYHVWSIRPQWSSMMLEACSSIRVSARGHHAGLEAHISLLLPIESWTRDEETLVCQKLALWPWENYFPYLCFSLFVYKMRLDFKIPQRLSHLCPSPILWSSVSTWSRKVACTGNIFLGLWIAFFLFQVSHQSCTDFLKALAGNGSSREQAEWYEQEQW